MLASLGLFVFDTNTALFDTLDRRRDWRHTTTDRFGARAASQYTGPGEDRISLSGRIVPELAGRYSSIETLAAMADAGEAYALISGSGRIFGNYVILSLQDKHGALIDSGDARVIDFSIDLQRIADDLTNDLTRADSGLAA